MYIHSGVVAVLLFNTVRTCHTTLLFACFLNNLFYFYLCDCVSVCTHMSMCISMYTYVQVPKEVTEWISSPETGAKRWL